MVPQNVHTPQQAGYAYNQIPEVPPNYQTPSQQVLTSPDNVSSAPTCSYSIDQFLDDIQLPSSPLRCQTPEPETTIAMQGTPEATRMAREIHKLKILSRFKKPETAPDFARELALIIIGPDVLLISGLRGGTGEKNNKLLKLDESKLLEIENIVKKQYKGSDV